MADRLDALVVGNGPVGLVIALGLGQALGARFRVAVLGRASAGPRPADARAYALGAASRNLLEALGAWQAMAPDAEELSGFRLTDGCRQDAVRIPVFALDQPLASGEMVGHIVPADSLTAALEAAADHTGLDRRTGEVTGLALESPAARVELADGSAIEASLVVAADGARSTLRRLAGIRAHTLDYGQTSVVGTVEHEASHEGFATQHFLPGGPVALLPLPGHRSSFVVTRPRAEAEELAALDDAAFAAALRDLAGPALGSFTAAGPRRMHPLVLSIARAFAGRRLALAGDAAHVVHPIAGQGVNLGLRDAAALIEVVAAAARSGEDWGALAALSRYERWRRFDTLAMAAATDSINRLFAIDNGLLRLVRDMGLAVADRAPWFKRAVARDAAGLAGSLPQLLKGRPA